MTIRGKGGGATALLPICDRPVHLGMPKRTIPSEPWTLGLRIIGVSPSRAAASRAGLLYRRGSFFPLT